MGKLMKADEKTIYRPLEAVTILTEGKGIVAVRDGEGREYVRVPAQSTVRFLAGGALGTHIVSLWDENGMETGSLKLRVDCETAILDEKGFFSELLTMLHYTMIHWHETGNCLYQGKIYKYFVSWLRDHVHTLKGMKYFYGDLKSAIELYRDSQRQDGMIWDNHHHKEFSKIDNWEQRFAHGDFVMLSDDRTLEFTRIPVENDVEYLYIEGIYYTWKATGDDDWMKGMLDSAIRAYEYTQNSPYRWSKKYNLLKRGFTIDTWDFQDSEDAAVTRDPMMIDPEKTRFGVMHGDNTGFAAGCRYLAEMLEYAGRASEAEKYRKLGLKIKERLDKVSWNGSFYTHHVPEDENLKRDLDVDLGSQISLSNAYALNRDLTPVQCAAIIEEYLKLKNNLPEGSPGEWYTIYPPFGKGFGSHNAKWDYMNGGVITIVAGELARGAFENGYEEYGVDILRRIHGLAKKHQGYLHCCFRGSVPAPPEAGYLPLDITGLANIDTSGKGAPGVPGWTGEGEDNDLHEMPSGWQIFQGVSFDVPDPDRNGRKGCIGLSSRRGYLMERIIPVDQKANSLYLLHTASGSGLAGSITLEYKDGGTYTQYINIGRDVLHWWMPMEPSPRGRKVNRVTAWEGKNDKCRRVNVSLLGVNNPHPELEISRITLNGAKNGNLWAVFGVTLSDREAYLPQSDVSFGIPDNWGAAAVVYGLLEGLAGVVDQGTAFGKVRFSPRWPAAGVTGVSVTVKYPASNGYFSYSHQHDTGRKQLSFRLTGNAETVDCRCLLPGEAAGVASVEVNGKAVDFNVFQVRTSRYAHFELPLNGVMEVMIRYISAE
ncbi:MAG: hypothetical protein ACM3WV_09375 [Bacillota bacterium]